MTGKRTSPARQLAPLLYDLSRTLRSLDHQTAKLVRLPPSELEVLRYLLGRPDPTMSEVAAALGLKPSNLSASVRTLEGRGLVVRSPDPADRRSVRLTVTMDALHSLARIEDAWIQLVDRGLGGLGDADLERLAAALPALAQLRDALDRER